jgi:hypothetical protein
LKWKEAPNYALPDDEWHVTAHYERIQTKAKNLDGDWECEKVMKDIASARICNIALHARTEFTPRANPERTSIQSLIKPNELGYVPHQKEKMLYTGPDVHNPLLELPEGAVDVNAIVSNGRNFPQTRNRRLQKESIVPGLGWEHVGVMNGYCDGSYNSECGRFAASNCLTPGHNDGRGGVKFDSYSGWLVMTLPQIKEGVIISKMETYHDASTNALTKTWTSIDNKGRRNLRMNTVSNKTSFSIVSEDYETRERRRLRKVKPPAFCDNFQFQFAIDNEVITTWNLTEFGAHSHHPQRIVELQVLLDDPNFTSEPKDVELAIRMIGCGDVTKKAFTLTHLYFA